MHQYSDNKSKQNTHPVKTAQIIFSIAVLLCLREIQALHFCCALMASETVPVLSTEAPWRTNHVSLTRQARDLKITTTGIDPFLIWKLDKPLQVTEPVLSFEYFCPDGIENLSLFPGPPITSEMQLKLPDLPIAEGWQEYSAPINAPTGKTLPDRITQIRLDLGEREGRIITIRNLRIRPPTQQERDHAANALKVEAAKLQTARAIRSYGTESFVAHFTRISVGTDTVTLEGTIPFDDNSRAATNVQLVEFPSYTRIDETGIPIETPVNSASGQFSITLPRVAGDRDRLYSGWRLRAAAPNPNHDGFLSARHFPSAFETNESSTNAPLVPADQKGLSGFSNRGPKSDLLELGISAVTVNLVLNRFLIDSDGPGREAIPAPGPKVYFNTDAFGPLDQLIEFCRQHKIVVSAIVLIPCSKRNATHLVLQHPETEGGVYAMPDLTSSRGAAIYGHLLSRIAERYSDASRSPGVITNWIAHNEVDYHPVWTNMGEQPDEIFLETYYRSMRMIHNAARQFNPHARVFVSLTHNWTVKKPNHWKQLSPKQTLVDLQKYSKIEGDFAWGVAYHPYPQSLFAPTAWNDRNAQDHQDTPLITMQNLQVLGDFLSHSSMRQQSGKRRGVLLSEQGYHTASYGISDQKKQAGSLHYAMQRVRNFPWVESFHYHRWIDHPDEGGLMLGLRTLPTKQNPHGKRKHSWNVYQAINTDAEKERTKGLPKP